MTMNIILIGSFIGATLLIASSAWLFSRVAYWAILVLLGMAIAAALLKNASAGIEPLGIAVAIIVYGAFIYFVTVQSLMQRKVTDVATRDDFKREMEASNRFRGPIKLLYHLPIMLLVVGILVAVIGKLSA
jgi:hypothetical protein